MHGFFKENPDGLSSDLRSEGKWFILNLVRPAGLEPATF
jgi:hypothetical protein